MAEWNKEKFTETLQALSKKAAEDLAFRSMLVANPNAAIKQVSGMELPDTFKVQVVDNNAAHMTMVLPPAKVDADELSGAELEQVAGGKGGGVGGSIMGGISGVESGFNNIGSEASSLSQSFVGQAQGAVNNVTAQTNGAIQQGIGVFTNLF